MSLISNSRGLLSLLIKTIPLWKGPTASNVPMQLFYRSRLKLCSCASMRKPFISSSPRNLVALHKCTTSVNLRTRGPTSRPYSQFIDDEEDTLENPDQSADWLEDESYREVFEDQYLLPVTGHRVAVIQPEYKMLGKKNRLTSADLQLAEAAALIETLPRWKVVDRAIFSVKHLDKLHIWGKGNFEDISRRLRQTPGVTAVFVGVDMLTGLQLASLQQAWGVPVYDRYTVVLQIFQTRARTKEAKLQVALAEIPYLKSRMRGIHVGSLDRQRGGVFSRGGGQTPMEVKKQILQDREIKLKTALQKVQNQRELLKKERKRREIPTVAVVGYTNAGKTSLIRALTGDSTIRPRDQLFATLDVTVHQATLPSRLSVLYVDTVGFISDIPTDLIASFSATLKDMLEADAIIVVNDVNHPDVIWQRQTVRETLASLQLPQRLADNVIEVNNKVDLLDSSSLAADPSMLAISTKTGQGLFEVQQLVEKAIIDSTGRLRKRLRIPLSGPHLGWLYKEATVEGTKELTGDTDSLLVEVVMTKSVYARFKQEFGKKTNLKKPIT